MGNILLRQTKRFYGGYKTSGRLRVYYHISSTIIILPLGQLLLNRLGHWLLWNAAKDQRREMMITPEIQRIIYRKKNVTFEKEPWKHQFILRIC